MLIGGGYDIYLCQVQDAGLWQDYPGIIGIAASTAAALIEKTISTQASEAFGGFTSSFGKYVTAEFIYFIS